MNITWINHASFMADLGENKLVTDPWIEGRVFNDGWTLLASSRFGYDDFSPVTHIWFSHEHPDHFFPPNLRKIPENYRRRITVLFHYTKDKRVLNVCKSMGFKTHELPNEEWVRIGDADLLCGRRGQLDSWLAVHYKGQTLVDLNDCIYHRAPQLQHIASLIPSPDVLITLFIYANWVGNPNDRDSHRQHAREKLAEMELQANVLRPKSIIPCASFIWFCHRENFFMNQETNRIWNIRDFCERQLGIPAVVLYPGDQWEAGEHHDSSNAIAQYREDLSDVLKGRRPVIASEAVSWDRLERLADCFFRKARERNSPFVIRNLHGATAYLSDLNILARISFASGLERLSGVRDEADIVLSSDSLGYSLMFDWGGDALAINGRYEVPPEGKPQRFFRHFRVASLNSSGDRVDLPLIVRKAVNRFRT